MSQFVQNFINGAVVESQSQRVTSVFNPATGEETKKVKLSQNEVDAAIAAADQASKAGQQSPLRRARILFKFKELLEANFDELARLISSEHGKIYSDAIGELTRVFRSGGICHWYSTLTKGEFSANAGAALIFTQSSNRWA